MSGLPRAYIERYFLARRRLVELLMEKGHVSEIGVEVVKYSTLLSPMLATSGPAGVNVAPMMLSFAVREEYLEEAIEELRRIEKEYWGKGGEAFRAASRFLLDYVYNLEKADPARLVTHLMTRGHTWKNVKATGEAAVGILFPPDEGALELRVKAEIVEEGPIYEYVNRVHDLMHAIPYGRRSHEWFPALILTIKEIYDNDFKLLGLRIYPPPTIVVSSTSDGRVYAGHFGDAEVYRFYKLDDGECRLVEVKENPYRGEHHHGHEERGKRARILGLIGDVQAIITAAMGPGGREFFEERGVKVYRAKPGVAVAEALESILGCRVAGDAQG